MLRKVIIVLVAVLMVFGATRIARFLPYDTKPHPLARLVSTQHVYTRNVPKLITLDNPDVDTLSNFILSLNPGDKLYLDVQSPGGDVFGAEELDTALDNTKGTVIARVHTACSAAAELLFHVNGGIIYDKKSYLLFHLAGGQGPFGGPRIINWADPFCIDFNNEELAEMAKGFSPAQVETVKNGGDFWIKGTDMPKVYDHGAR